MDNEEELQQIDNEPKKPSNPFKRAKTKGKTIINTTYNFSKKIIRFFASPVVPLPVKIAIVLIITIVILVVVILDVKADSRSKAVSETINSYVDSENVDEEGKKFFKEKASLIKMPLKDINAMYEEFKNGDEFTNDVKQNYDYILGTNEIGEGSSSSSDTDSSSSDFSFISMNYDKKLTRGQDGTRDDSRVEYITGSRNRVSSYKTGGSYVWSNGKIGSVNVEIVEVAIRVWTSGGGTSVKYLQINKKLKEIVIAMFNDIYNDPSHPVINEIGAFRKSDGFPGHPFGVAIDINPDQNPMPGSYGNISNYKPGTNPLSMDANHAIVKIIRDKYGWAWGGDFNTSKDYMHFSFWGG